MRNTILMTLPAALLVAAVPRAASAAPTIGAGALSAATEALSPVENVHYYGYGRGYYGGYGYGGGYYGYGRGYYGGYGRGYYGGYGRGYYGGYGRGYYGGYGRGYYGGYGRGYY